MKNGELERRIAKIEARRPSSSPAELAWKRQWARYDIAGSKLARGAGAPYRDTSKSQALLKNDTPALEAKDDLLFPKHRLFLCHEEVKQAVDERLSRKTAREREALQRGWRASAMEDFTDWAYMELFGINRLAAKRRKRLARAAAPKTA